VTRRYRFAAPSTAVAVGVLTLLLIAVDVPLDARIHTLAASNAWELDFVLPFTLVGTVVAPREPRNPMGWILSRTLQTSRKARAKLLSRCCGASWTL
jgi:hypothetical protein